MLVVVLNNHISISNRVLITLGTVDAITYTVDRVNPLRLKPDLVKEEGSISNLGILNHN